MFWQFLRNLNKVRNRILNISLYTVPNVTDQRVLKGKGGAYAEKKKRWE